MDADSSRLASGGVALAAVPARHGWGGTRLRDAGSGTHSHPGRAAADCLARAQHRFRASRPSLAGNGALLEAPRRVYGARRCEAADWPGNAGALGLAWLILYLA